MNYSKLISDVGKHHYFYVHKQKVIRLSSDSILSNAKEKAKQKIQQKLNVFKGESIIRMDLKKINKNIYQKSKIASLTGVGGPIVANITFYKVTPRGSLKIDEDDDRNSSVYLTESYINRTDGLSIVDLRTLAKKAFHRKLDLSLLAVNKIDNFIKIPKEMKLSNSTMTTKNLIQKITDKITKGRTSKDKLLQIAGILGIKTQPKQFKKTTYGTRDMSWLNEMEKKVKDDEKQRQRDELKVAEIDIKRTIKKIDEDKKLIESVKIPAKKAPTPAPVEKKVKAKNPWIAFVKSYRVENPHLSYKDAIKEIKQKGLYVPGGRTKKPKKERKKKVHICVQCNQKFTTKSNLNRHNKKKHNVDRRLRIAGMKGFISKMARYMKNTSISNEQRNEYRERKQIAEKQLNELLKTKKPTPKKPTPKKPTPPPKPKPKIEPVEELSVIPGKITKHFTKSLNKAFRLDVDKELNLNPSNIVGTKNRIMHLKNVMVDGKDIIALKFDPEEDGTVITPIIDIMGRPFPKKTWSFYLYN